MTLVEKIAAEYKGSLRDGFGVPFANVVFARAERASIELQAQGCPCHNVPLWGEPFDFAPLVPEIDEYGLIVAPERPMPAMLPPRVSEWPTVKRLRSGLILAGLKALWRKSALSGKSPVELHHLFAGTVGRDDAPTAIIPLTPEEHRQAHGGQIDIALLLGARWALHQASVDWVRLHLLARRRLPKPRLPSWADIGA